MNTSFQRSGQLMQLDSYPQWAQDVVGRCEDARDAVVSHEMWDQMGDGTVNPLDWRNFSVGLWPVIEGFPGYMARSLLKTRFGRSAGDNLARRWLVRNIRVEQNHARYWLDWAEATGVPRTAVLDGPRLAGTQDLAHWCEHISGNGTLAAGIAATNYAIEGATGDWARRVYESEHYADTLPATSRTRGLRWLQLHAAYDDRHPWEALEIICTLLGTAPSASTVTQVTMSIRRTYHLMQQFGDRCMRKPHTRYRQLDFDAAA